MMATKQMDGIVLIFHAPTIKFDVHEIEIALCSTPNLPQDTHTPHITENKVKVALCTMYPFIFTI